jgi:23S rRNA (uracil1939-C5)-methyltransferase
MQPQRIVYVSCNPNTLARDVKALTEQGYTLQNVQPVDMFPHSMHVEAVVSLKKV